MLSAKRDAKAAKRFFRKMLKLPQHPSPRVINVDRNKAYPPAVEELKEEGVLSITTQLRQCKYLNNIVEQDHRFIKRRVNPGLGFFSFKTARRTIGGYETINMIRKGQVEGIGKGDIRGHAPDGSVLAINRSVGEKPPDAIGLTFDGTASIVLARNAFDPIYSPEGGRIAFLRGPRKTFRDRDGTTTATWTDLYTMNAGGGGRKRLTKSPRAVEVAPRWDPSGQRLAYTELRPLDSNTSFLGFGNSIFAINSDGSCRTRLLSDPRAILFGATWQPGPGREAGRIAC